MNTPVNNKHCSGGAPDNVDKTLESKTKEQLIADIKELIKDSNNDSGECNSDKIKATLNSFIDKYTPSATPDKTTKKGLNLVMQVYADKNPNSKGYHIYDYKVKVLNEEYPFSSNDEVNYFLRHLVGYIENSNLPKNARKADITNFFRSYDKILSQNPIPVGAVPSPKKGGKKQKSRVKISQKRKHRRRYTARRDKRRTRKDKKH